MNVIGIDLGGTNVKAVLMTNQGKVLEQVTQPIRLGDWKSAVMDSATQLRKMNQSKVDLMGLAAPGLPDVDNKQIDFMPGRLPGLEKFNWSEFLNQQVSVINDAHAALLAEVNYGVARGIKNVVMLTLGTGVGGGILINGELYQGLLQRAGSIGDISLNSDSEEIGFLQVPGTLEDAIGNESIPKRSGQKFQSTRELVAAFEAGDRFAEEIWMRSVKKLAVALCSIINVLAPEMIVLGGGIAQAEDSLFKPLASFMNKYEWRPNGKPTPIVKANFNEYAGAIGAACFAIQRNVVKI